MAVSLSVATWSQTPLIIERDYQELKQEYPAVSAVFCEAGFQPATTAFEPAFALDQL